MGLTYLFDNIGVDAGSLLVACVVVMIVSLMKTTILKNLAQSPFFTLLPFLTGILLYAGYYAVLRFTANSILVTVDKILQEGFSSGCYATVISAFLDKCFGKTKLGGKALVIRKLLEGFVEEDCLDKVAKQVAAVLPDNLSNVAVKDVDKKVGAILTDYQKNRKDGVENSAEEMEVLARLIVATLQKTT